MSNGNRPNVANRQNSNQSNYNQNKNNNRNYNNQNQNQEPELKSITAVCSIKKSIRRIEESKSQ